VPGVTTDDVEAGLLCAHDGVQVPAPVGADIRLVHGTRLQRVIRIGCRYVGREQGHFAAVQVSRPFAIVHRFDGGQCAVFVHGVAHTREVGDVLVRPQPSLGRGSDVARGMDIDLLRRHYRPATLGLDAAHGGHAGWKSPSHAVAVRRLVKPVPRRDRSDFYRFEENVIAAITRHWRSIGLLHQTGMTPLS